MTALDGLLFGTVMVCTLTDLFRRKIYNAVLLPVLLLALLLNYRAEGLAGLGHSAVGLMIGLAILFIPFVMGGMGAGDVKFLAVIGAVKGPYFVFLTALGMGLAGGVIGLVYLAAEKRLLAGISNLFRRVWMMALSRRLAEPPEDDGKQSTVPYGVAIAAGAVAAYFWLRCLP
ncbi:MAG: prepilin peptidase [Solirubrobacterales bacterium]